MYCSARDVGKQCSFPFPLHGFVTAPASTGSEAADDDRGGQVDGEREPVAAVGERERVERRQKEEVKASMLAIATGTAYAIPKKTATGRTAKTYSTPRLRTGTKLLKTATAPVTIATASTPAAAPANGLLSESRSHRISRAKP
jgi:hypothetical protein